MPKEAGPRERALRDMREANYERRTAKPPSLARLKNEVAKVAKKKRPAKKSKKR